MNDDSVSTSGACQKEESSWKKVAAQYQQPSVWRSCWQLVNTLGPYALLWYLMHLSLAVSWWITVPLAMLAGLFLVRVFIIFHDCGHGSFFKSRKANNAVGFLTGLLTFTPYFHWRWEHAIHHATAGDLDRRSVGDIWTMTVQEYLAASPRTKLRYRLARNPVMLFFVAPLLLFLVWQRIPSAKANARERNSVYWMNLGIVGMVAAMSWAFGLKNYALIQIIVMMVAGGGGVWMFYVQHQFETVYWERGQNWDYTTAALQGSSFYKLPKVLQWFSGNIGFHHIHHLNPRIPNYNLEKCHQSHPLFQSVKPLTILTSLKSFNLRLWDEQLKKMVGYRRLKELDKQAHHSA